MDEKKKILIAITGASGSGYGINLISHLITNGHDVHLIISDAGRKVMEWETKTTPEELHKKGAILYPVDDIAAPPASGSFKLDAMVICPCTMGTLAAVANSLASNLIHRTADVMLKERRRLILVVRETPIHTGHIKNLLKTSEMGGIIMPASPGFYHKPDDIKGLYDFITAKVMDILDIKHNIIKPWSGI